MAGLSRRTFHRGALVLRLWLIVNRRAEQRQLYRVHQRAQDFARRRHFARRNVVRACAAPGDPYRP